MSPALRRLLTLDRAAFARRFVVAELLERAPGARWVEHKLAQERAMMPPRPSPARQPDKDPDRV